MVNRRKSLLLLAPVIVILAVALTFPTSAFTTTTLERGVTVSVASDDQGLVALIDGHAGGVVEQTQAGTLTIDFSKGGANGANVNAQFTLGDPANPSSNHAFRIVNQGTQARDFTFSYVLNNPGQDGSGENIRFEFYRNTSGSPDKVVSETQSDQTISSVGVGESIYVIVEIDTNGVNHANTDLSGTLEIVAGDGGA